MKHFYLRVTRCLLKDGLPTVLFRTAECMAQSPSKDGCSSASFHKVECMVLSTQVAHRFSNTSTSVKQDLDRKMTGYATVFPIDWKTHRIMWTWQPKTDPNRHIPFCPQLSPSGRPLPCCGFGAWNLLDLTLTLTLQIGRAHV